MIWRVLCALNEKATNSFCNTLGLPLGLELINYMHNLPFQLLWKNEYFNLILFFIKFGQALILICKSVTLT